MQKKKKTFLDKVKNKREKTSTFKSPHFFR